MAHSYICARKNSNIERAVAVPDGALILFMYFFNETSKEKTKPNSIESEICDHYKIELLELHTSYIDLMLEEIAEDAQLRSWYLPILFQMESSFDDFGEYIDHDYLNQIPELEGGYPRPIPISTLKNLINDIYWVLDEGKRTPSGQYKWFEENI